MSNSGLWSKLFGDGGATIESAKGPLLKIMVGENHIADLYHDDNHYCLLYKDAFKSSGLPPFNPEDLGPDSHPVINHCYKRENLWFVFSERLRTLERSDVAEELKKFGLTKNSDPILILGTLGKISIAKPWYFKLVK